MCMVSVVPRVDPRAMPIELNPSTYSSNLGKRRESCASAFYSIVVSNSGFFCPISCPNMTNVSQDGVSEGRFKSIITEELNLIRSSSPSLPLLPRVRAPNDLLCLLKTASQQMHIHDLMSNPQSRLLSLPRTTSSLLLGSMSMVTREGIAALA